MTILYILLILMIIGAIVALEVPDLLSSVVAVGAVGLSLSIAFLLMKAPDVAITQLVVEIIAVIILIRATLKRDLESSPTGNQPLGWLAGAVIIIVAAGIGLIAFRELPVFGYPEMRVAERFVESGLVETGATNLVAAVLLDYRAYDTLGEATVLFTAVIGVLAVMRKLGRKPVEEIEAKSHE